MINNNWAWLDFKFGYYYTRRRKVTPMSTVCVIGMIEGDGRVRFIYCHNGGDPTFNGHTLLKHYTNPDKIRELLNFYSGEHQDWCIAYGRDRGDGQVGYRYVANESEFMDWKKIRYAADYAYLFKDGEWHLHIKYAEQNRLMKLETYFSMR